MFTDRFHCPSVIRNVRAKGQQELWRPCLLFPPLTPTHGSQQFLLVWRGRLNTSPEFRHFSWQPTSLPPSCQSHIISHLDYCNSRWCNGTITGLLTVIVTGSRLSPSCPCSILNHNRMVLLKVGQILSLLWSKLFSGSYLTQIKSFPWCVRPCSLATVPAWWPLSPRLSLTLHLVQLLCLLLFLECTDGTPISLPEPSHGHQT